MGDALKQHLLLLGGFAGFALVFATGIAVGKEIETVLFESAIGCVVGGVLFKWISGLIVDSWTISRRRAAEALAAPTAPMPAPAQPSLRRTPPAGGGKT